MTDTNYSCWLPTIPYSLIDAINRMAAATGSVRYAQFTEHANYNGHAVGVHYNSYRRYHLCEYFWGGRQVLSRGSLESALRAGAEQYRRGDRGTVVKVSVELDECHAALARELGYVAWSPEIERAHDASYRDARYDEINGAMQYEAHGLCPAVGLLANSASVEEYRAKCEQHFAERKRTLKRS